MARSPRLVLMDEPTAGLDPEETDALVELIAEAVVPVAGLILIEHKPDVVAALCPMAILLDRGRKVAEAPPAELFAGDAFRRAYLGVMDGSGRSPSMRMTFAALALAAGLGAAPALAADRARATMSCKPASEKFAYDCTFKLTNARTGAPLEQAQVTIGADMPVDADGAQRAARSATATGAPGDHQARLMLEMHGDWAVRLRVARPIRDQIVEVISFERHRQRGPPRRKAAPARGEHKH